MTRSHPPGVSITEEDDVLQAGGQAVARGDLGGPLVRSLGVLTATPGGGGGNSDECMTIDRGKTLEEVVRRPAQRGQGAVGRRLDTKFGAGCWPKRVLAAFEVVCNATPSPMM